MSTSIAVLGLGAVGARAVRQLASTPEVGRIRVADTDDARVREVVDALAEPARVRAAPDRRHWWAGTAVGILATPAGTHRAEAERLLESGVSVVSVSDAMVDVEGLLALDEEARERGLTVVAGAAFAPGLSCVLAAHAAAGFDTVDEVHIAKVGTGGRACARQRHRALAQEAREWRDGAWARFPPCTGRSLRWFPDPVGAEDCYRAAVPDALLLQPVIDGVDRISVRVAANRRDRLTARLPMLRPPPLEGGPGAIRVEVRGRRGAATDVVVFGAMDRPAVAAGAVAALAAVGIANGDVAGLGAGGLAGRTAPVPFLAELARRGVKAAVFDGTPT